MNYQQHSITKSELFTVYNKARAFARRFPHLVDPKILNRAFGILQSTDYFADKDYFVSDSSCTCPDAQYRKRRCKHITAFWLMGQILAYRQSHDVTELVGAKVEGGSHV